MNPLISSVIHVYNAGKHLNKCMRSVLTHTYYNFKVTLADYGSADSSGKMCDEYTKRTNGHETNDGIYGVRKPRFGAHGIVDGNSNIHLKYLARL